MPASCTLAIKVVPNAPRSAVAGWLGEALKVKVHAPPVEGRANEELCSFLATFGLVWPPWPFDTACIPPRIPYVTLP